MKQNIFFIALMAMIITGCGNDSSNQSIVGIWETPNCFDLSGNLIKVRFEFNRDDTYHQEVYYYESSCESTYEYVVMVDGNYTVSENGSFCTGESRTVLELTVDDEDSFPASLMFYFDNDIMYFGDGSVSIVEESDLGYCYNLSYENYYIRLE